jgi:hypothetical protein
VEAMMKLVFVHGRSQHGKDPLALLKEWREAWVIGLKAAQLDATEIVDIKLPFYGDELDRLVKESEGGLLENARARGEIPDDELVFKAQVLDEIAREKKIVPSEINANYRGDARERGALNWQWVQAILRTLDKTPIGASAIDQFTHDVWVYLRYPAVRTTIDAIVAAELKHERCVVVGHSLGSIVGYNVLRTAGPGLEVPRYVTVGSPLGVYAIQNLLDLPLEMPACTKDWFNARDERDVVALRPLDDETFSIDPPIRNKTTVQNRTDNGHGIIGYLDDRDVAREIFTALH